MPLLRLPFAADVDYRETNAVIPRLSHICVLPPASFT